MAFTIRTSAILRRLLAGRRSPNSVPLSWQRIAATAFSPWLFILFFRGSESRRIQREISGYQQALREAEEAHRARQNTLIQNHNLETAALRSHYIGAEDVLREAFKRKPLASGGAECPERSQKGAGRTEGGTESARIHPAEKELALETTPEKARKYVAGERHNTELARLEAEKAEERRRNACATAERRRRKLKTPGHWRNSRAKH